MSERGDPVVTDVELVDRSAECCSGPSGKVVGLLCVTRAAVACNPDRFPSSNETFDLA